MDIQRIFTSRIGGKDFGIVDKSYKFSIIDRKKNKFLELNPGVALLDLGLGEPEQKCPQNIIDRLYQEASKKKNQVYPLTTQLDFCQACATYLKNLINVNCDPQSEIILCLGAKPALAGLPFAFLDPGDTVLATTPGYSVFQTVSNWIGANVIDIPISIANQFLPEIDQLEALIQRHSPKVLLLNYPNNPTGAVANIDFYNKVVLLAQKYSFIIIQDAPYSDFVYNGVFCSPLQVEGGKDVCLEVYSFSKSFNMQGFRIGFVAGDAKLIKAYATIRDNIDSGQFIPIQKAAIEALENNREFTHESRLRYQKRQKEISSILQSVGITTPVPAGGMYLYAEVPKEFQNCSFNTAMEFCDFLISRHGIITVPFEDPSGPHIRLSMTFETQNETFKNDEAFYKSLCKRLKN